MLLEKGQLGASSLGLSGKKKKEPIRKDRKWKEIWGLSDRFSYLQSPKTRLSSLVSTLYVCYHPTIASFLDYLQLFPCQFPFLNFQLWWEKKISTPVIEVTSAPSRHTSSWVLSKVFTLPSQFLMIKSLSSPGDPVSTYTPAYTHSHLLS